MTAGLIVFGVLILAGMSYAFWRWGRDAERTKQAVEKAKVLADVTGELKVEKDPEQVAKDWERLHGGS